MSTQEYTHEQFTDKDGRPTGGEVRGVGLSIDWQDGPLGRGEERLEPNGAFVETLIQVSIDRLNFYQNNGFACIENAQALSYLQGALQFLNERTARREAAGVEGTHEGS